MWFFGKQKETVAAAPKVDQAQTVSRDDDAFADAQIAELKLRMRALCAARKAVTETHTALDKSVNELAAAKKEDGELQHGKADEVDGDTFRTYLTRFRDIFVRIEVATKDRKEGLAKLGTNLFTLRRETDALEAMVIKENLEGFCLRLRACHVLAARLVKAARDTIQVSFKFHQETGRMYFPDDWRKPGEPRKKAEPLVKKVVDATEKAIAIHSKTKLALLAARRSVDAVSALTKKEVVEPQKPTSEEVGRYLLQLLEWCREHLPTNRQAGKDVQHFREMHATMERDVSAASRLLSRIIYLENQRVDPDLVGMLKAMRKLLDELARVARDWRFTSNSWALQKFDRSEPLLEITAEEKETIEHLEAQVKNVGVAAAGKVMAKVKHDSLRHNGREKMPNLPALGALPTDDDTFERAAQRMQNHISAVKVVDLRNEKARAEIEVAWDAYETSRQRTKQAAAACLKIANTMERLLIRKPSDEMRIHLHRVAKLQEIHSTDWGGFRLLLDANDQAQTLFQGNDEDDKRKQTFNWAFATEDHNRDRY